MSSKDKRALRTWAVVGTCGSALVFSPLTAASADTAPTPSGGSTSVSVASGVTSVPLAQGKAQDGIVASNSGPTNVTVRTVKLAPRGSTGWHYHTGPLLAVVTSGTLTEFFYDADTHACTKLVRTRGQAFVEMIGPTHVHVGVNRGSIPVVLTASYVLPAGSQLAVKASAPPSSARGCPR